MRNPLEPFKPSPTHSLRRALGKRRLSEPAGPVARLAAIFKRDAELHGTMATRLAVKMFAARMGWIAD
jgi:hypothetical protein